MTGRGMANLTNYLHRQTGPASDPVSDGELLRRYAASKDEVAFELLVRRHGPTVLSAAQRILRDEHAAEDVLQASFMVLCRKAGSLKKYNTIAGWVYRVTTRIALRARKKNRVISSAPKQEPRPDQLVEWNELRHVVDEEIDRLPSRFRDAVALCYFSGRTTEEAAKQLGCPKGTILSRLSAARDRLRVQLRRRGYAMTAAALTVGLTTEAAPAGISGSMLAMVMKSLSVGASVAPAVATLAQGALNAMLITKVKIAAVAVCAAGLIGVGVGQLAGPSSAIADDPPAEKAKAIVQFIDPSKPVDIDPLDRTDTKLMKEKFNAALRSLVLRHQEFNVGRGAQGELLTAAQQYRDAALELFDKGNPRLTVLERFNELMNEIYQLDRARFEAGAIKEQNLQTSKYLKLDAELQLFRATQEQRR